ncbi:MAG: hypothetical protein LBG69_05760 [Zoogloeaceae bacterium]|nr:hypothetical protein [Zoogloeaceae bacterium]
MLAILGAASGKTIREEKRMRHCLCVGRNKRTEKIQGGERGFALPSLLSPVLSLAGVFLALLFSRSALPVDIYQGPLIADKPMEANVLYILDDSGSMTSDSMPDSLPGGSGNQLYNAFINRQYYNPDVTYLPPFKYEGGKLVRLQNSDKACPSNATTLRALSDGYASQTACKNFSGGAIAAYNLVGSNGYGGYYDYVPGYRSRRDNPSWNEAAYRAAFTDAALRADPYGYRFETDPKNYEYWAFRQLPAGNAALFRTNRTNSALKSRSHYNNSYIVNRHACPRLFNDVTEGRAYYKSVANADDELGRGVLQPNLKYDPSVTDPNDKRSQKFFGIPTATCRESVRIWDVDEPGNIQGWIWHITASPSFQAYYSSETTRSPFDNSVKAPPTPLYTYLPFGRRWCERPGLYADPGAHTLDDDHGTDVSCISGKHRIGDTVGDGSFTGADDALVADNINSAVCQSNINCFDQSLPHLVSTYVDDDGNLAEYSQKQRRTRKDEIRNYANWYSYYRTRAQAARAGASLAFAQMINPEDTTKPGAVMRGKYIRLGYDTINKMGDAGPGQRNGNVASSPWAGRGVTPFRDFPNAAVDWQGYPIPPEYRGKTFVKDFFDWNLTVSISGVTPLIESVRRMGQYYKTAAPWKEYPPASFVSGGNGGSGNEYGCRRSFGILMTDGYGGSRVMASNGGVAVNDADGTDGPAHTSADGTKTYKYQRQGPFFGQHASNPVSGSLADWAMYYWKNDLRPTPNNLAKTKKDPAFWQHMQLFTVGLGVQGRLSDTEVNNFLENPEPTQNILWTYPTGLDTNYEQIDDLMHAGLNGHGGTAAAEDPDQFVRKLSNLLTTIAGDAQTTDKAAGGGGKGISEEEYNYYPSYDPAEWTGDVSAFKLCSGQGGDLGKRVKSFKNEEGVCNKDTMGWKIIPSKFPLRSDNLGSVQEVMAAKIKSNPDYWKTRKIFTWDGKTGVRFDHSLSAEIKKTLDSKIERSVSGGVVHDLCPLSRSGAPASACMFGKIGNQRPYNVSDANIGDASSVNLLIDYLLGDGTWEDTSASSPGASLNGMRSRKNQERKTLLLGDVINPSPYLLGNFEFNDYGFGGYKCGSGSVSVANQACTPEDPVSFLSAADIYAYQQRFHGFRDNGRDKTIFAPMNDGMLHAFDADTGEERFAYIPQAAHPFLKRLADPDYGQNHRYFVDGAPFVSDILLNGAWHSVLVGSTGRGGRGFFALDVEDVQNFDASKVIWEFTNHDDGDLGVPADIDPVIAPIAGSIPGAAGPWAATLANGYNSDNGDACLFVVSLETQSSSPAGKPPYTKICTNSGPDNGLSTPYLLDVNKDGAADYAFAGDLKGNVWRFDLRSMSPLDVRAQLKATDTRNEAQPITAPPIVIREPQGSIAAAAFQVLVGSGKFMERDDVKQEIPDTSYPDIDPVTGKNKNKRVQTQTLYSVRVATAPTGLDAAASTASRANLLAHVYDLHAGNPPGAEFVTREKDPNPPPEFLTYKYEGWKSDDAGIDYDSPSNSYKGFLLELNGANMGASLVRAQATLMDPKTQEIVIPFVLPSDDPCSSALQGGIVSLNYATGKAMKHGSFKEIKPLVNLWRDPDLQGQEEQRDSKYAKSNVSWVTTTYPAGAAYVFNQPGGPRFSSGDHDKIKHDRYGDVGSGRPSGRQSWTQIR